MCPNRTGSRRRAWGGQRLGILGLGAVGRAVAARAAGFELEMGYCGGRPLGEAGLRPFADGLTGRLGGFSGAGMPFVPGEAAIVNGDVLRALGPRGVLVNVVRGGVVHQAALITALRSGTIAAAALDVIDGEPAVPAQLRQLHNLILTPHIAAATSRAAELLDAALIRNVAAFFNGETMPGEVGRRSPS